MDLPAISLDNCVKLMNNVEIIRISVVLNENNFLSLKRKSVDGIGTDENLFSNSHNTAKETNRTKSLKCCRSCCIIY